LDFLKAAEEVAAAVAEEVAEAAVAEAAVEPDWALEKTEVVAEAVVELG
jgi:hypothetical protein